TLSLREGSFCCYILKTVLAQRAPKTPTATAPTPITLTNMFVLFFINIYSPPAVRNKHTIVVRAVNIAFPPTLGSIKGNKTPLPFMVIFL
ncbi:hypothetical protein, partial [Paenibacillus chitinolyticus]|uniref:hypothetical protein n=1 Tax=Paenibacillus chitinolyticus TaxID=79263 RepID=UPI00295ECE92